MYFSKSEGAIKDNKATFFNISVCGGITGDKQLKQCTSSPTSVCMRSSDNAVFALADTASCDVTYNSTKRHVQFVYNYSSSAWSTFHNGTIMVTLICGQHLVSTVVMLLQHTVPIYTRDDYNGLTSDIFQTILLNFRPLIFLTYGCPIKLGTNVAINGICPIISEIL